MIHNHYIPNWSFASGLIKLDPYENTSLEEQFVRSNLLFDSAMPEPAISLP